MPANLISADDCVTFESLYSLYASKLFGFIRMYTETKEQAAQYLEMVFLQACRDISYFDYNAEKKLLNIVLVVCKPVIKLKTKRITNTYSTTI